MFTPPDKTGEHQLHRPGGWPSVSRVGSHMDHHLILPGNQGFMALWRGSLVMVTMGLI